MFGSSYDSLAKFSSFAAVHLVEKKGFDILPLVYLVSLHELLGKNVLPSQRRINHCPKQISSVVV